MNRYEKIRKIGEGAFGKAYLMKEKATGHQVVVKETNLSKLPLKERDDARRETAVLAQMKHPAIVTYHDSFEEFGNLYIVMDYCDGGDLAAKINAQHGRLFSEEDILDWMTQLCLAVKHIHDRNILHRDIKCQNIFLTRAGQIKLGDFGIAKILDSTVQLSHTLIGTPYYFSPEICMGKPYNHKSDIWSLGCVFYELATLRHAFDGQNLRAVMQKIQGGTPPPISRSFSPELTLFISSILKKNPRDRPSVNTLLQRPIITKRINKFLTEEQYATEFSHTVLHGERLLKQLPRGAGRGAGAAVNGARRPQSAQAPQARANLAPPAANPAQRPSTAADGQRQQQQNAMNRNRPPPINEDEAAVRGLPQTPDSDNSYRDPYMFQMPPAQRAGPVAPRAAPGAQNIPAFRPLPFPSGSRGGERGNYNSYLEFLKQLDQRRHEPPPIDPAANLLVPQPMNRPQQQPQQQQRPSTAQQNGRINVVNPGLAKQLVQNQQKRPSSANVNAAPPRNAFVRPMKNPPPPSPKPRQPPIINKDQQVFDRLQKIRQANLRNRNAQLLAAQQQARQTPLAANNRPPSAGGMRPAARQLSQDRKPAVKPPESPPPAQLTEALMIVQVQGIAPSPRVPASVVSPQNPVPKLTDALKAVTPREVEQTPPQIREPALPIDQNQLKKMRQAELQKANANPPIIIGDRPFWLPNQSISEDLDSLTPEMTGSKMVATIENKQKQQQPLSARKPWEKPKEAKSENETFAPAKVARQRPSWAKSSQTDFDEEKATKESVALKLATGQFDACDFKLLRTCSLPSLAGEENSPPASTVSTLELLRSSIPVSTRCLAGSLSISELNRTIGLSTSSPDLMVVGVTSPSLAVESLDLCEETLKLDDEKPKVSTTNRHRVAWSKEPVIEEKKATAKHSRNRKSTSSINLAQAAVEKPTPSVVQWSIATTVDDDVDKVSKSMANLLVVSPQENQNFADVDDAKSIKTKKTAAAADGKKRTSKNNGKIQQTMKSLIEQLSIQTDSLASSISSDDGGAAFDGDQTDVGKLVEELEKINGPETPPIGGNDAKDSTLGAGSTLTTSFAIDALEESSLMLLDTATVISLNGRK